MVKFNENVNPAPPVDVSQPQTCISEPYKVVSVSQDRVGRFNTEEVSYSFVLSNKVINITVINAYITDLIPRKCLVSK